jgi:K+-sensing histidine kinase KdpD
LIFQIVLLQILKRNKETQYLSLYDKQSDLEVYIDRNLMDKVYFNLLSNAFKFTPAKERISIVINEDKLKNQVKFLFKDSGIGIRKMN